MKKLNLRTAIAFLTFALFVANTNAERINLLDKNWTFQTGVEMEMDDDEAIFLLTNAAPDPWGGAFVRLSDIDVDKFSHITIVTTDGDEGILWNLKISVPNDDGNEISHSFFSGNNEAGDQTTFDKFTFELTGTGASSDLSGVESFSIWIFLVGHGKSLTISELYLHTEDDGVSGLNNVLDLKKITHRAGGITLNKIAGSDVAIYAIDGSLVKSYKNTNNNLDVNLEKGLYIVNVNGKSAKVSVF